MITKEQVEKGYSQFLADERSDHLKRILSEPNIFSILKVSHYEIRHSNFLAWLLNPHESHGLGTAFLERTLRNLALLTGGDTLSIFDIPRLVENKVQVYREWNNIDILIELNDLVITIENKIYSAENGKQLSNYKRKIEEGFSRKKQLFIYLTPLGKPSSMPGVYFDYSYLSIIENLESLKRVYCKTISTNTLSYISDYIQNIKLHVMGTSEANVLAKKLYYSHKDLFDFVIKNIPDPLFEFSTALMQKVNESKWTLSTSGRSIVRFTTKSLEEIIPRNCEAEDWKNKEAFLFEIAFVHRKIKIYCTIPPGDDQTRAILKDILDNAFQKAQESEWYCYYNMEIECSIESLIGKDEVDTFVEGIWSLVNKMVEVAETSILLNKEKFSQKLNHKLTNV